MSGAGQNKQATQSDTLTEKAALSELLLWSQNRPAWQQDALRRLIETEKLDEQAINELTVLCLDPKALHTPFSDTHIASGTNIADPISILSIDNPTAINALADDQKLKFSQTGITVIYGDNGSGKSGYVRILKHACRSRDEKFQILRDIEDQTDTPQSATITYVRGSATSEFEWSPEGPSHEELPSVSIFDSRSANIHVESTNEVAYIPRPMRYLEALAEAAESIKDKLQWQITALEAQTPNSISQPTLSPRSAAGYYVASLSAKSDVAQLETLATLSEEEKTRLAALEADFSQDSQRAVARLNNQRMQLESIRKILNSLIEASNAQAFSNLRQARKVLREATEASEAASQALFSASPLFEVGHNAWLRLWEAARNYTNTVAYPSQVFPEASPGDLCVLCQQPLTEEVLARRQTFESFVKSTTKVEENTARTNLDKILSGLRAQSPSIAQIRQNIAFLTADIGDKALGAQVRITYLLLRLRLRAMLRDCQEPAALNVDTLGALKQLSNDIEKRAAQLSADPESDDYKTLHSEFIELKDRAALKSLVPDLKAQIDRLKEIATIKTALEATAKKPITDKNKKLSDKMVTDALRGRFVREVEKLKISRMPIELRKVKDQKAVSYFRVALVEHPNTKVGEIFSEGEHRCVALAVFLAELVTAQRYSGIVFDDPMSSLDHINRKAVAARLVEEAAHRQVIIFTHDLVFLYELRREAENALRPVEFRTIRQKQNKPGFVETGLPDKAKSGLQLCNAIRSELRAAKPHYDNWNDTERVRFSKGTIGQLRDAWEQAISDFIRPVMERFDNKVKPTSFFKFGILSGEDIKSVMAAQARLSEDLHSSGHALNPDTISHSTLVDEVKTLEHWINSIRERQKNAIKPPIA